MTAGPVARMVADAGTDADSGAPPQHLSLDGCVGAAGGE